MLTFTVQKMYVLPDTGTLKAFADIVVCDEITIRGVRVLEGKRGLFVTMPKEQGKDSKWFDIVTVNKADTFDRISDVVMKFYKEIK